MLSQLIDEPYFDPRKLPTFHWADCEPKIYECPSLSFILASFCVGKTLIPFRYQGKLVNSSEQVFKIFISDIINTENEIIRRLMLLFEFREGNSIQIDRNFIETCKFLGVPDYPKDRNVATLLLKLVLEDYSWF